MFSYDDIQKYSETEIKIYKYIISNSSKVQYMTIRELAKEIHASTSTVLRFCNKNGFESYSEFKDAIKSEWKSKDTKEPLKDIQEIDLFFKRTNSSAFEEKISIAAQIIRNADQFLLLGLGSSGALAKYGARYFSNMGKFAVVLEDTLYPIEKFSHQNTVVLALSESGETKELIEFVKHFQKSNCSLLSITNLPNSTLAKLSDWNFSYHINHQRVNGGYNATTQVPALFVIEALARRI